MTVRGLIKKLTFAFFGIIFPLSSWGAQVISLNEAITQSLQNDHRIKELEHLVDVARAKLQEAQGSDDFFFNFNTFIGMSPAVKGGLFTTDPCGAGQACETRRDRFALFDNGVSPWAYSSLQVVKPLMTFGKIEHFSNAAQSNIKVKEQDVRQRRGNTVIEVKKAYYGHLTSRESRIFLEDTRGRIESAVSQVRRWLDRGEGSATQADLYALETASAMAASYVSQAQVLEKVSLAGIRLLAGLDAESTIELADKRLQPVALPALTLDELKAKALMDRPEMSQLQEGLNARRELVAANKSMTRPNIYIGFAGKFGYSPLRDRVDNPYVHDSFNDIGGTPILGLQWDWNPGVYSARMAQEQAELGALLEKSSFAREGIPFQVMEAYEQAQSAHASLLSLEQSAKSARRWMITAYTDFEAGVTKADKIVTAFQGYVLAYTSYLKSVYEYNMYVANLDYSIGAYQ